VTFVFKDIICHRTGDDKNKRRADNNSINTNLVQHLPRQPLGPPLNAKKLNLCRLTSFSALKFSGLNVSGFGYSCGQRCVMYGDTNTLEPFGSSKFAVKKIINELKSTKKDIYGIHTITQTSFYRTCFYII